MFRIFTGQFEGSPPFGTVSRQKGVCEDLSCFDFHPADVSFAFQSPSID